MRLELVEDVFGDGTLPQLRGNAPGLFKGRNRLHVGQGAFPACLFIGGKIQMHREHAIARRVRLARRLHIAVVIVPRGIPFMILVGDVRFVVVWSEHTPTSFAFLRSIARPRRRETAKCLADGIIFHLKCTQSSPSAQTATGIWHPVALFLHRKTSPSENGRRIRKTQRHFSSKRFQSRTVHSCRRASLAKGLSGHTAKPRRAALSIGESE